MAKYCSGGRPVFLKGKPLRQLVEEHIGYVSSRPPIPPTPSELLGLYSPMLSFTPSRERAFSYAERQEKRRLLLEECPFEDATHFVWQLDIELSPATEPGVYDFTYLSDPQHCREIVARQLQTGAASLSEGGTALPFMEALGSAIAMAHASADESPHIARLIDADEVLTTQRVGADDEVLRRAREFAQRDQEWLLYPLDPMPDGKGLSARFVMNQHLSVAACYRLPAAGQRG